MSSGPTPLKNGRPVSFGGVDFQVPTGQCRVTLHKEEMLEMEGPETPPDTPLLERSSAAVKVLIRTGKKRGYVTHDQINSLAKEVNSEQIEDILAMFNEMGINVGTSHRTGRAGLASGSLDRSVRVATAIALTPVRWSRTRPILQLKAN
jgi:Sigma-70 factor, region 1.1